MGLLSKYYDLKTSQKMFLLAGFMTICLLSLGYLCLNTLSTGDNEFDEMFNGTTMPVKWINEIATHTSENEALSLRGILAKDGSERARIAQESVKSDMLVDELFEKLAKADIHQHDKEALQKINDLQDQIATASKEIGDLSNNNSANKAYAKYLKIVPAMDKLEATLSEFADEQIKKAEENKKLQDADVSRRQVTIYSIVIVAIVLSFWFACFIALRIQGLLDRLNQKMKLMASGDLTVEKFGNVSKCDVGEICDSFDKMIGQMHNLISSVSKSVEDISASSEEMSASAEQSADGSQQTANSTAQLAQGAQEMSYSVEQGASSIGIINKAIQDVLLESVEVSKLGNQTEINANNGSENVKKAVKKIDNIKKVSADISVTVTELGALSSDIEQIVDLIKNIAGQTNLLSLNAAIEAARAGEHGKGFAVVASEVKQLANQSAEATIKISGMIKNIQIKTNLAVTTMDKATQEVEEGVNIVNEAGIALEKIINQVKSANEKIQTITQNIDRVAVNSNEMVGMIERISAVTEETAASAEEISSITEEQTASMQEISASSQTLAKVAERLNAQVSFFKT